MTNPITQQKIDEILSEATITLGEDTIKVADIVGIQDPSDPEMLMSQPSRLASFGVLVASARRDYETAKFNRELEYAQAFSEAKAGMEPRAGSDKIEQVAKQDELYIEKRNLEIAAQELYYLLTAIHEGLQERGRMLQILNNGHKADS